MDGEDPSSVIGAKIFFFGRSTDVSNVELR